MMDDDAPKYRDRYNNNKPVTNNNPRLNDEFLDDDKFR